MGSRLDKRGATTQPYRIANGVTITIDDHVSLDGASGDLVQTADVAGLVPLGFAEAFSKLDFSGDSLTGDTSLPAGSEPEAVVGMKETIVHRIGVTGVTGEVDKGKFVYATGPTAFTLSSTANIPAVGEVARYLDDGENVDVRFYSAETIRGL